MKGLLVKDLRIVFRRKQQLLILLAICTERSMPRQSSNT